MRERSTWNRTDIAKQAGMPKRADPYTMNQDHVKQQPSADQYVIGGPSEFAEDVHPSTKTWEAEYSSGQVKRNEIGMPEMRGDTFNHPEKTASEQVVTKKAALCVSIARAMLPKTASDREVEAQALSFMYLPDAEVMATYKRVAQDEEEEQDQGQQGQQQKQAQQDQTQQGQDQGQGPAQQQKQAQQGQGQSQDQGQQQGQAQQGQAQQGQAQQGQTQEKQASLARYASQMAMAQYNAALKRGDKTAAQQALQMAIVANQQLKACGGPMMAEQGQQGQPVAEQQQQAQMQQQAQQDQMAQMQQQMAQLQQQVANMIQQAQGQGQQGQQVYAGLSLEQAVQKAASQGDDPAMAAQQLMAQMQQQQAQMQQQSDDQLIDDMLAEPDAVNPPMSDVNIDLEAPTMDTGDVQLGPEDAVLQTLFANEQVQQAEQAAEQQQQKQAAIRTASTRTVGARPTGGVSRIGGGLAPSPSGGKDLSSIWNSAPDVREVFGLPNS